MQQRWLSVVSQTFKSEVMERHNYDYTDLALMKLLNMINLRPLLRHRHFEYLLCVEFLNCHLDLQSYSLKLQRPGYEDCLAVEAGEDWLFFRLPIC